MKLFTWRWQRAGVSLALSLGLLGCATLEETYYLAAEDKSSGEINYFRINLKGSSSLNGVKYSIGLYDKHAVEQLFGENRLKAEHEATALRRAESQTDAAIAAFNTRLTAAERNLDRYQTTQLKHALASAWGAYGKLETQLTLQPESQQQFASLMVQAKGALDAAQAAATSGTVDNAKIAGPLRRARGILVTTNRALNRDTAVRFFDGSGQELDVSDRTMVVFVSSDSSPYTNAIRELASADEVTNSVLQIVVGERQQLASSVAAQVAESNQMEQAFNQQLQLLVERSSDDGRTNQQLQQDILDMASQLVIGKQFTNEDELAGYLEGLKL